MTYCLQMLLNSKYKPCVYDYYHGHIAMIPVFRYNEAGDDYDCNGTFYTEGCHFDFTHNDSFLAF